jgi:hypothetical protein
LPHHSISYVPLFFASFFYNRGNKEKYRRIKTMRIASLQEVEDLRAIYKQGMQIKLVNMVDPQPVPPGTIGTIEGVDDFGDLLVKWENGSSLKLLFEVDEFEMLS